MGRPMRLKHKRESTTVLALKRVLGHLPDDGVADWSECARVHYILDDEDGADGVTDVGLVDESEYPYDEEGEAAIDGSSEVN